MDSDVTVDINVLVSHAKLFSGIQKLFDAMACTVLIFMPYCP